MNFVTAPLIADIFLLAISAIGREEVRGGTIGANSISPIDIMLFFLTLAYIAISIDASGLIRYLAFKVLQWGGDVGHRLFFYLYVFFFGLGSFIGNDPIILSGTAFLAYMTRVSSNIVHPRAWIFTQFAVANIASAILVSSNPTNLVLAGAFNIKFISYTANMIVPVIVTAIVLFPFLLYIVFADESLIPFSIKMHELPDEVKNKKPVNPNIPHARGNAEEEEADLANDEKGKLLSLEEVMNPFLDKGGAAFGAVVMTATLITLLALNAASASTGKHHVFWVTLPAAFIMFCWDLAFGWCNRHDTRDIARKGREEVEKARAERAIREEDEANELALKQDGHHDPIAVEEYAPTQMCSPEAQQQGQNGAVGGNNITANADDQISQTSDSASTFPPNVGCLPSSTAALLVSKNGEDTSSTELNEEKPGANAGKPEMSVENPETDEEKREIDHENRISHEVELRNARGRPTLVSLVADAYTWSQETFPTVTAVLAHLPFALVPFAFAMFVLVQALVTKGWVNVFAYGWDHWVEKTGTIGSIGGMGFLSVILCNVSLLRSDKSLERDQLTYHIHDQFAGTNIGTTILLSRVIQAWERIHSVNGTSISDRTFWATVYSMALGVNYGAFSTAFSASLAGLLWRDILARKHIHVRGLDFARVNLPIIAIAMTVGCAVLVGEVYIIRDTSPHISLH
jgi:Na+/H+ antiporter NhaD/arsenite permease-like protein